MSDIYTRLVANVLFPVQERLKHHDTVKVRQAMEESQWWPRSASSSSRPSACGLPADIGATRRTTATCSPAPASTRRR
jgi:hypothetical protein